MKSCDLLAKFTALHIWGEKTGFEIQNVCTDIKSLFDILNSKSFDLLIIENSLAAPDDYKVLKKMMNSRLCRHFALCSADGDFESARKGIVLGVDDYFTLPFDSELVMSLFSRIRDEDKKAELKLVSDETKDKLFNMFVNKEESIFEYLDNICTQTDIDEVIDSVVERIFDNNEWLDLYVNETGFLTDDSTSGYEHKNKFIGLFEIYKTLFPNHSEILNVTIDYILYNPESDLRQKSISEELRINKSYLSTVFIAQTGIRFVDYITSVKLHRAAWLLLNTAMKINEIANRMDYRDVAYFSKQFKKNFGETPSEYRMPDDYHFEI